MSFGIPVRNGLSIGLLASTFLTSGSGRLVPRLTLNFLTGAPLDNRITFTRSTTGTFVGSNGLIQSAAIDAPRFDYNPATLASLGLLIEEQRTNLLLYSEQFDNAIWVKANVTVTANTAVAPDGTTSADKVIPTAANNPFKELQQNISVTAGVSYTLSFYAKADGYSFVQFIGSGGIFGTFFLNYNLSTGVETAFSAGTSTITQRSITPAGSGWYRISVTATALSSGTGRMALDIIPAGDSIRGVSWASDGTSGILHWGAQMEAGAFVTSYIPTVAATVTRAADIATMTGTNFSSWYNASEGTVVAGFGSYANNSGGNPGVLQIDDGASSNSVRMFAGSSVSPVFNVNTGGVSQAYLSSGVLSPSVSAKMAGAYALNNFAKSLNGAALETDASGTVPVVNRMLIGSGTGGVGYLNGYIRSITYYASRLTNAQLQAITA